MYVIIRVLIMLILNGFLVGFFKSSDVVILFVFHGIGIIMYISVLLLLLPN